MDWSNSQFNHARRARPYPVSPRRLPMGDPPTRPIESVAWMERNLNSSISAVYIDDVKIIAGDWDGMMICWSRDGDKLWVSDLGDRIVGIRFSDKRSMLWCIAGREAFGIDYDNGAIKWRIECDGSTDLLELDGEERAWLVSSVYDIELNDFIESTISLINSDGEVVQRHILDERPWTIQPISEGRSVFGLGRPRGGILELIESKGELEEIHDSNLDCPVLCGSNSKPFFLGQTNGNILKINDDGAMKTSQFHEFETTIVNLENYGKGVIVCLDDQRIITISEVGTISSETRVRGDPEIVKLISEDGHFWASTLTDSGSILNLINEESGIVVEIIAESRIRDFANANGITVVGLDDGRVIAIEQEMLRRRIENEQNEQDDGDEHRLQMREKLRLLRK